MQTLLSKIEFLLNGFGFKSLLDFGHSTFGFMKDIKIISISSIGGFIAYFTQEMFGQHWEFILAYALLIAYEWRTGILAAKLKGEKLESRKSGRMLLKISVYTVLLYILNTFQKRAEFPTIKGFELDGFGFLYWIFLFLVIWQLVISVAENLTVLGYKWADKFIKVVNRHFYKKFDLKEDE